MVTREHYKQYTTTLSGYRLLLLDSVVQSVPCSCGHFLIYCALHLSSNHVQFIHQSSLALVVVVVIMAVVMVVVVIVIAVVMV
jgi:hypothetical protein